MKKISLCMFFLGLSIIALSEGLNPGNIEFEPQSSDYYYSEYYSQEFTGETLYDYYKFQTGSVSGNLA